MYSFTSDKFDPKLEHYLEDICCDNNVKITVFKEFKGFTFDNNVDNQGYATIIKLESNSVEKIEYIKYLYYKRKAIVDSLNNRLVLPKKNDDFVISFKIA